MRISRRGRAAAVLLCLAALVGGAAPMRALPQGAAPDYKNPSLPVERRVADLLSRMTLEEKVAQTLGIWADKRLIQDERGNFSPEKARSVLQHGIGQISRPNEKWGPMPGPDPVRSPRDAAVYVNEVQKFVVENTRLGIPVMFHEESLHGFVAPGATSFPQAIALASTWNPALLERIFSVAALEARARGVHHVLAPVLDIVRDPRWGRTEETYGEDPYLVSRLGVAAVRGFQGSGPALDDRHVFATAKHLTGHGQPEGGTNVGPAPFSERVLREAFLVPFRVAIAEANIMSVMPSYNEVDGVPSHANTWLLGDVLRREWGFRGLVVSDYEAIKQLEQLHHVAADKEEAARLALAAGVDIELPDPYAYPTLAQQVRDGRVPEAQLDAAVASVLRAKFLAGLFENPYVDPDAIGRVTNTSEHQALALQAARESIVLLKNQNGLLPLDRSRLKTFAVIGPNAADVHLGGYSNDPGRGVSVLQGVRDKLGAAVKVVYAEGVRITETPPVWSADEVVIGDPALNAKRIEEAVKVARTADAVLLVVGDNEQTNREAWAVNHLGDRDSLDLLGEQNDLVRAVLATGKPTIVLLTGGKPLSINYVAESVPAILEGWYLGQEGGTAVADVLFGDYNPAGRLPITFPRSVGQIPAFYNMKPSAKRGYLFTSKEPLFPFGHGLSYTTFRYGAPRVSPERIGPGGTATVSVDVTNAGRRAGDEVVQLYVRDLVSSVTRPVKELKGFERISLAPGETKTVTFTLGPEELRFLDRRMEWVVEPGAFEVMVGPSSADVRSARFEVVAR